MSSAMNSVEIRERRIVKPCSPTPPELKQYELSLLDQLSTSVHGNMTFFYPGLPDSLSLQASLSRTLPRFPPFAGRLLDSSSILCSDDGVCFVDAHCPHPLASFLSPPVLPSLHPFNPSHCPHTVRFSGGCLLLVQLTSFSCGASALGLSLSHKIADFATLLTLLKSWSHTALGSPHPLMPHFVAASVLPPSHLPPMSPSIAIANNKFSARRFVFSPEKIGELKARVVAGSLAGPSRVEVVLAQIWKCAISARKLKTGRSTPSVMFQAVNLRRRMEPPLAESTVGNFIWPVMVVAEEEAEFEDLVVRMRKAMSEFNESKANRFRGEEAARTVMEEVEQRGEALKKREGVIVYKCTSWCGFPVLDSSDFGWGKATWHYSANNIVSNTIALMDTKSDGGVEALVTLDDDELSFFECHPDLLAYASPNPTVYTHI